LIGGDPAESIEIGIDDGSIVGDYGSGFGLTGRIDEVRIYHQELSAETIARHAAGGNATDAEPVLQLTFDGGKATDSSGRKNHGQIEGATAAEGKSGEALKFTAGQKTVPGFKVKHHWSEEIPLMARAMVLVDDTLFIAGPADTIDEEQAMRRMAEAETQQQLAQQADAMAGGRGGLLWAVSKTDGNRLAELELDATPVFDGMAAAAGRLYFATTDGRVVCLQGKP